MAIQNVAKTRMCHGVRMAGVGFILAGMLLLIGLGCAKLTASVPAGAELGKLKTFYVVRQDRDGRAINELIRDDLATRGVTATTGPEAGRPQAVDAIVTYEDRWAWDITMYMLSLNISVRHGTSNVLIGSAQSYRPSLERKEPREMVKEVLDTLFAGGK